jgi:hypothetical protein
MSDSFPPDPTRTNPEDLARLLAERLPPQPTEDQQRATSTTEALGGLHGLGFDHQQQHDDATERHD